VTAQLGGAHVQRHLAALEAGTGRVRARAGLLALDPAAGVAALARAHAAADALAVLARLRGLQVREIQVTGHYLVSSTSTRCRTLRSMPASAGLSSISFVLPIRPRPSARSVPRWRSDWPIWLLTWVSLSFAIVYLGDFRLERQDLVDLLAARLRDFLRAAQLLQRGLGGLQHVDRV